jgi:A1 cistron-splicing factor AAR2
LTEQLEAETDAAELLRWRANLGSVWRDGLSPYQQNAPQEATEEKYDWPQLTDSISPSLLSRIVGATPDHWSLTSASSARQDLEAIPGLSMNSSEVQAEKELNVLPIDLKRPWREGATGRERTEAALDHTWYLRDLVENHCLDHDVRHILGELQFCFIMVLTLNNYSCLEQWKRILMLLLTCRAAIADLPDFYVKFLASLRLQLQHCQIAEGGLFDLADESGSLLKQLLHKFKLGLRDISGIGKSDVMDELDELENYLRGEHGWEIDSNFVRKGLLELEDGEKVEMDVGARYDEEDESGEYAPTIVDLTSEEMAALGIDAADLKKLNGYTATSADYEKEVESEDDQDLEEMDTRY